MEREFIRVRSIKDIIISSLLLIAGTVLVILPTSDAINIAGFFMLLTGLLLFFVLKSAYKDNVSGEQFNKKERFFSQDMHERLCKAITCPHDMDFNHMEECMNKAISPLGWSEQHRVGPYLFVDPESELIQKLHAAYVKHTGDTNAKPMTMGGGTYAKSMPNTCVAFGMEFEGSPNQIHENNEVLKIDELLLGTAIYAEALYELVK